MKNATLTTKLFSNFTKHGLSCTAGIGVASTDSWLYRQEAVVPADWSRQCRDAKIYTTIMSGPFATSTQCS
jgi:hypothetical protein